MFRVDLESVKQESGEDIIAFKGGPGRLALLAEYLYGCEAPPLDPEAMVRDIRLSPSIIVRSESELLGISSPRFAFRASLGEFGFVTIRRRCCTHERILDLHGDQPYIYDLIPRVGPRNGEEAVRREWTDEDAQNNNWIAECLLAIPARWRNDDWNIITCNLSRDFGEDYVDSFVPFVTHVQFGGGLCAQAACFMVLCLLEHSKILGISEITYEAARWAQSDAVPIADPSRGNEASPAAAIEDLLRLRGLRPVEIERFFDRQSNLTAQRQFQPIALPFGKARICKALRTYIKNNIPVIQIVSLARMFGQGSDHPSPIIELADRVDPGDYNKIPLGTRKIQIADDAGHCVVIIGCSDTQFLINDPATYPFIPCSDAQVVNICPPRGHDDDEAKQSLPKDKRSKPDDAAQVDAWVKRIERKERLRKLHPQSVAPTPHAGIPNNFQAISVTPKGVALPLLHFGNQVKDSDKPSEADSLQYRSGLFAMVDRELIHGSVAGLVDQNTIRGEANSPSCLGDFYLVHARRPRTKSQRFALSSPHPRWERLSLPVELTIPNLPRGMYWVHHTRVKSLSESLRFNDVEALYFWGASKRTVSIVHCLVAVFIRQHGNWQLHYLQKPKA